MITNLDFIGTLTSISLQKQIWRFTNCRCLYEDAWDLLAMIILTALALKGFLAIAQDYLNYRVKKRTNRNNL